MGYWVSESMDYGSRIPANQVGKFKILWSIQEYGIRGSQLQQVTASRDSKVHTGEVSTVSRPVASQQSRHGPQRGPSWREFEHKERMS